MLRRAGLALGAAGAGFVVFDTQFRYSRATRNLRSCVAAVQTLYDYKIAIKHSHDPATESQIHDRVAKRWYEVCAKNGGLYVKLGQSVTTLAHVLPPEYLPHFRKLLDEAPSAPMDDIERIVKEDFGASVEEVFATFNPEPVASASIAQVHEATLPCGQHVAVKIQKPWIKHQIDWDLACYQLLVAALEWAFDLPIYWATEPVCASIRAEADFVQEGLNSERAARSWRALGDAVHVPRVFWSKTTKRVMTQEFVEGIRLHEVAGLEAAGFKRAEIARRMVGLFAHQIFVDGFVHGDPHPGNILVRRAPPKSGRLGDGGATQLVVLDHGMYVDFSEGFRLQYCELWKALVLGDTKALGRICRSWGIGDQDLFASFQLLKPFSRERPSHLRTTTRSDLLAHASDMSERGYDRVKRMLNDSSRTPRELVVLGRNLNIVRANNAAMGSPANRVGIMARGAARGAARRRAGVGVANVDEGEGSAALTYWLSPEVLSFEIRLFFISASYHVVQLRRWIGRRFWATEAEGFEEVLKRKFEGELEAKLGLRINLGEDEKWESVAG